MDVEESVETAIDVHVLTMDGERYPFSIMPSSRVQDLKSLINDKISIPIQSQRLIYLAKVLESDKPLKDYGITKSGLCIQLVDQSNLSPDFPKTTPQTTPQTTSPPHGEATPSEAPRSENQDAGESNRHDNEPLPAIIGRNAMTIDIENREIMTSYIMYIPFLITETASFPLSSIPSSANMQAARESAQATATRLTHPSADEIRGEPPVPTIPSTTPMGEVLNTTPTAPLRSSDTNNDMSADAGDYADMPALAEVSVFTDGEKSEACTAVTRGKSSDKSVEEMNGEMNGKSMEKIIKQGSEDMSKEIQLGAGDTISRKVESEVSRSVAKITAQQQQQQHSDMSTLLQRGKSEPKLVYSDMNNATYTTTSPSSDSESKFGITIKNMPSSDSHPNTNTSNSNNNNNNSNNNNSKPVSHIDRSVSSSGLSSLRQTQLLQHYPVCYNEHGSSLVRHLTQSPSLSNAVVGPTEPIRVVTHNLQHVVDMEREIGAREGEPTSSAHDFRQYIHRTLDLLVVLSNRDFNSLSASELSDALNSIEGASNRLLNKIQSDEKK